MAEVISIASTAVWKVKLIAFTVGAASLGAEIAGARLLAPYFGASTIVWANTIATVLVALAIGYWVGGRVADRWPNLRGLATLVLVAALLLALIPFVSDPLLELATSALDNVSAGGFIGSLLAVLALLAVPIVLLGAVAPYAIRLSVSEVRESGTVAGRLYAISTVGSLFGTFLSALLLVPLVGTRFTFLIFAGSLVLVTLPVLRVKPLVVAGALLILFLLPTTVVKAGDGARVIHEAETQYQYVRVLEESDGERTLELNEGQAVHSRYKPGEVLTGDYWDDPLVLPSAAREGRPRHVAILGSAAGTTSRAFAHFMPETYIDAVDIDPKLDEIGRKYFDLGGERVRFTADDARPFLRKSEGSYDLIMVDAYRQPYIPFYLATQEFFEICRERLARGGVLVINIGHPPSSSELERVLTRTVSSRFHHLLRDPIGPTNTLLVASEQSLKPELMPERVKQATPQLEVLATTVADRVGAPLDGGEVFTDDRAPVEWLIDRSFVQHASE